MPRNSSGTYSLPVAAFVPGGLIKSADLNSDFSDIATALTQSLATTGVSTMTGPIKAASGTVAAPSMTFNGALATGFYLAGANQIGWAANGVQGALFNSDTSVTFNGTISAAKGTIPIGLVASFAGSTAPSGWLLCYGQLVSTSTYASLFAILSTTYGSGGGMFGIPDYRGRVDFGQDNMGGVAANRITVAGGNFDGTILGGVGGLQNHTLTTPEIPSHTHINTLTDTGHTHGIVGASGSTGGGIAAINGAAGAFGQDNLTQSHTTGIVINNIAAGGGGAHTILSPGIITNRIIYAGV